MEWFIAFAIVCMFVGGLISSFTSAQDNIDKILLLLGIIMLILCSIFLLDKGIKSTKSIAIQNYKNGKYIEQITIRQDTIYKYKLK